MRNENQPVRESLQQENRPSMTEKIVSMDDCEYKPSRSECLREHDVRIRFLTSRRRMSFKQLRFIFCLSKHFLYIYTLKV